MQCSGRPRLWFAVALSLRHSGAGVLASSTDSMTPSVKVEKIHPKMDGTLLKPAVGPACPATVSSSVKPGLNCPSIPKPTLPSPGQILNGKGLLASPALEKKSEDTSNNRKFLNKRLSGNATFVLIVFSILCILREQMNYCCVEFISPLFKTASL